MSGRDQEKKGLRERLEQALLEGEGKASLEAWLEFLLPRRDLEDFARSYSLKIKGFRPEKAPLRLLVARLAKAFLEDGGIRGGVLARLQDLLEGEPLPGPPRVEEEKVCPPTPAEEEVEALRSRLEESLRERDALELRERELEGELEKVRSGEKDLRRRVLDAESEKRKLEEQVRKLRELAPEAKEARDLRRRLEALEEENERLRASLASMNTDKSLLEREVEDLRKRKTRKVRVEPRREPPPSLPQEDPDQWHIPVFEKEFQETLLASPAQEAQRILKTVFFACQDPFYPSLNLKKLEGKGDLWSVRVDPGMRLIFLREGKVFRFLAATDREDQDTELKSLRERYG